MINFANVLILVVVDDGLVLQDGNHMLIMHEQVLILVVVDDGLVLELLLMIEFLLEWS